MGIKEIFGGKQGGLRCEGHPDGLGVNCEVYEKHGNEKISTGTHVSIAADPDNNCETSFDGGYDLSDGDEARIQKISQQVKNACMRKKGFA